MRCPVKPKILGAPEYIALRILRDGTVGSEGWEAVDGPAAERDGLRGRLFKLRRASRSRPGDVFLQVGEGVGLEGAIDFGECADVTWAAAPVFDTDLAYRPARWK